MQLYYLRGLGSIGDSITWAPPPLSFIAEVQKHFDSRAQRRSLFFPLWLHCTAITEHNDYDDDDDDKGHGTAGD